MSFFKNRLQRAIASAVLAWFEDETIEDVRVERAAAIDIIRELEAELAFLRKTYERVTGLPAPERPRHGYPRQ